MNIRFMNEKLTRNKAVITAGRKVLLTNDRMSSPIIFHMILEQLSPLQYNGAFRG